jgi:hypothetical protein
MAARSNARISAVRISTATMIAARARKLIAKAPVASNGREDPWRESYNSVDCGYSAQGGVVAVSARYSRPSTRLGWKGSSRVGQKGLR